jgi:F-type H+-transporting ATPase subunit delta
MLRLQRPAATFLPRLAQLSRPLHASAVRLADDASKPADGLMSFTFTLPSKSLYENMPVEMVILPGNDGQFGAMASHVPTIAELKPGVVAVQETSGGALTKYFIPGGFASISSDSKLRVSSLECAAIEDLDTEAIKTGLAQYQAAYASATDDLAKAEAEIGVEVYQAMSYAIADA